MKSLSLRIAVFLLAAQMLGFVATGAVSDILSNLGWFPSWNAHWNDLAEPRARALVMDAIRSENDRPLRIEAGSRLRDYAARAPSFRYAVFDPETMAALDGSSKDLSSFLAASSRVRPGRMEFSVSGIADASLRGVVSPQPTPHGTLLIATYGYVFGWEDFPYYLYELAVGDLKYYLPEICIAVAIGWFALKRGLEPLAEASREAEQIGMSSLHRRIPLRDIPTEIEPLVGSMNSVLDRLDEGAERQRRFLANAAHELRTPVAILAARLDHPDAPGFVNDLKRDVRQIGAIIEQLLASARPEKSNAEGAASVLLEIARKVVNDRALLTLRQGKHLELEVAEERPVRVLGAGHAIESVVANLVDNAVRAEPVGGAVVVRVDAAGAVEVIDHGAGVKECDRDMIFEPFWRKTEATPGTGLGLAISKELVERLGGAISLSGTAGGGATFRAAFRLDEASAS